VQRTHHSGLLGYGIYFADQFTVSHKYTTESEGSRFILIADVALGSCKPVFTHDTTRLVAHDG
jgi:Poly(ADP-ribose) polymerase catalytic domain